MLRLPAWQGEAALPGVLPMPAREGEARVRSVLWLPPWPIEEELLAMLRLLARPRADKVRCVRAPTIAEKEARWVVAPEQLVVSEPSGRKVAGLSEARGSRLSCRRWCRCVGSRLEDEGCCHRLAACPLAAIDPGRTSLFQATHCAGGRRATRRTESRAANAGRRKANKLLHRIIGPARLLVSEGWIPRLGACLETRHLPSQCVGFSLRSIHVM